ncbi:MAG: phosphoenolpyruvate synthase [Candidatus Magasanikbacteria bacterium CG10_big_fil_rev_8_21_14_0_10_36_32]|uniref:Phosphoenolpyruvate synthase n=1 Tax=Candidatus Magasanikbacteria bacterium CG10_big_fil_rev_8_21_14_0_10_36_32 TaxID=1974646 RepID=A0A2M6W5L6_9BACT|nr:MAG: phosphoenolpyruvate synthase [Candidatus Magasanikbacteria bacterium CG10_big_fil_rev_8_21_14_0_10_36_32]
MYIRWFKDLTLKDLPSVGGKNASLGELYSKLISKGIRVPNGFAITAGAYQHFIKANKLDKKIKDALKKLDGKKVKALSAVGKKIREMILAADMPKEIEIQVVSAYHDLAKKTKRHDLDVAVRSSATAEDLPDASFAGQQETYLNVRGEKELLMAVKKCMASLWTDRAISYRDDKDFDHMEISLSVGIQEMIRSDLGQSGVMFTLDTESGFRGVVLINAAYGLGEYVVKGRVVPDQFYVFKGGLMQKGCRPIISRRIGSKEVKLVYNKKCGTKQLPVSPVEREKFCISDDDVTVLAKWGVLIEQHYGRPMDIEWAKDGYTGQLFIVQARSETVKSQDKINIIETYKLSKKSEVLLEGISVGQKIGVGKVRIIESPNKMKQFKKGEILVTRLTDPDWEPIMRQASAIITEQGGKTSHAAIVSRELGTPCIVGAEKARQILKNGETVTVSCAEGEIGYIYRGTLPFVVEKTELKKVEKLHTKIMMNVGDPTTAFNLAAIPNDGVGLAREEFIFTDFIKIHPMALVNYAKIKDKEVKEKIDTMTIGYKDKTQFCVDKLAEGIAFIAAAFSPNDVIVRLSDFKTNEYASLIGGKEFEPKEENPMMGWRGASRYYDPKYKIGFEIECRAIKKLREEWGLKNVIIMIPFCRTPEEGKKVIAIMKEFGLERGKNGLQVYVMCEIPSNVILAKEFSEIFDGFSIGSNDLTQLTLGVDRDSSLVSHIYDENNEAVKSLISRVIKVAHKYGRKVGICGQAPSDYPAFAEFLVREGIDSISLNPDTVLKTRQRIAEMEHKLGRRVFKKIGSTLKSKTFLVVSLVCLATVIGGYFALHADNLETMEFQQLAAFEHLC